MDGKSNTTERTKPLRDMLDSLYRQRLALVEDMDSLEERISHLEGALLKLDRSANPVWANQKAIAAFFSARPAGMHVDHIVPLGSAVLACFVAVAITVVPAFLILHMHTIGWL